MAAVSESWLRRAAAKKGLRIHKARGQMHSNNEGGWMIVDAYTNTLVAGERYDLTDEDVADHLDIKLPIPPLPVA